MERYREKAANFLGSPCDFGNNTRGRQRDAATAQCDAFTIHGDLHRSTDVFDIIERLAHAHQNDVRKQTWAIITSASAWLGPFIQIIARQHDLTNDLRCGQVAHQFLRARMAERTGQRAANLGRHAQRSSAFLRNVDNLNLVAARNTNEVFAGAIFGHQLCHQLRTLNHEILGEHLAIVFGQVGHDVEIGHTPVVDPLPHLIEAHLGLLLGRTCFDQCLTHLFAGHASKVFGSLRQFAGDCQDVLGNRSSRGHSSLGCG